MKMARGRGGISRRGGGGGQDKSNKSRRRQFSKTAFKRHDKKKKSSKDKLAAGFKNFEKNSARGSGGAHSESSGRGEAAGHNGPGLARWNDVEQHEPTESESEEEETPINQLLATFSVTKTNEFDSAEGSDDEEEESGAEGESDSDGSGMDADTDDASYDERLDEEVEAMISGASEDEVDASAAESDDDCLQTSSEVSGLQKGNADTIIDKIGDENVDNDADDADSDEDEDIENRKDPFSLHLNTILDSKIVDKLNDKDHWQMTKDKLPSMGNITWKRPSTYLAPGLNVLETAANKQVSLRDLWVKKKLHAGWKKSNAGRSMGGETFGPIQREIFALINSYVDLLFCNRTQENSESVRSTYCLHALNHVLKTRVGVIRHTAQLGNKCDDVPDDFRDQGLTRPKVLILVPFRESALRVVQLLGSILCSDERANVTNKKRFQDEFGSGDSSRSSGDSSKPPDYQATFAGNIDDSFMIGIGVANKALRLYVDLYSSDIILASPLGLRMKIGADGDKNRDHDFMSSIELLIVDQVDVLLMQNWEHVLHVISFLHKQPKEPHDVDFSRVRQWVLEGWGKQYRQTLLFTSFVCPEVNALFGKYCCNYAGAVKTSNLETGGSIQQVAVQIPQVFQRFQTSSPINDPESRFEYFVNKVLPQFKESIMLRTMIYVPSYFDFVRLRNYLRKEDLYFVQISEYHNKGKVTQARYKFCHQRVQFLLYTERAHFYNRYDIKGIGHLVFYQLPSFPHFYSEICNLTQLQPKNRALNNQNLTCTIMYSRYDAHRLAAIIGSDRAAQMLSSDKDVHLLVTGEGA